MSAIFKERFNGYSHESSIILIYMWVENARTEKRVSESLFYCITKLVRNGRRANQENSVRRLENCYITTSDFIILCGAALISQFKNMLPSVYYAFDLFLLSGHIDMQKRNTCESNFRILVFIHSFLIASDNFFFCNMCRLPIFS